MLIRIGSGASGNLQLKNATIRARVVNPAVNAAQIGLLSQLGPPSVP
jgi:hypothetical protein